jgi:hypothetical protein
MDREAAILNIKLMTGADKFFGFVGSIFLIFAFFLPLYSFAVGDRQIAGSAISFFLNMPLVGGYASWGGEVMIAAAVILALIVVACPIAGFLNIIGLLNKKKGDNFFEAIKGYSRFVYIPMFLYILLVIVLLIGTPHPFGSLGAFGDDFNLSAVFRMTGLGFWLSIAGMAIVIAERRGL